MTRNELYEKMRLNVFMSIYNTKELLNLFDLYEKEFPKDCFPTFHYDKAEHRLETLEELEQTLDDLRE